MAESSNCHSDIVFFHQEKVILSVAERKEMRDRRDTNRKRLKDGLESASRPVPKAFISQGSYAMKTMVNQEGNDYDVDDGAYFSYDALLDSSGSCRSAADIKDMVCDALKHGNFKTPPQVKENCVRVNYDAGYHVDIPVYRERNNDLIELASDDWVESDPASVTDWFFKVCREKNSNDGEGGEFQRAVRLLKAFARSRSDWKGKIASGLMITKLAAEKYIAASQREDLALYDAMQVINARLAQSIEISHPTNDEELLTKGDKALRVRFFREKLAEALEILKVLDDSGCSRNIALEAWGQVFDTDFFAKRGEDPDPDDTTPMSLLLPGQEDEAAKEQVDKKGGGRYA